MNKYFACVIRDLFTDGIRLENAARIKIDFVFLFSTFNI